MNPILSLKNVSKTFERGTPRALEALRNITLDVFPGEIVVLLGPSGSGKSTILRIMSGLEKEYQGQVALGDGVTQRDMSFVFQQFALLPWLTVYENIEIGLVARGIPPTERKKRVERELERFGLKDFPLSKTRTLSGGLRQRAGIARALVTDPKVVFMDEPFSELDSFTAEELKKELLTIWREHRNEGHPMKLKHDLTIVMVTHIVEDAILLADRIVVLTARPGKIEKIISNTLPRPRQKRSDEFYRLEDELRSLIRP